MKFAYNEWYRFVWVQNRLKLVLLNVHRNWIRTNRPMMNRMIDLSALAICRLKFVRLPWNLSTKIHNRRPKKEKKRKPKSGCKWMFSGNEILKVIVLWILWDREMLSKWSALFKHFHYIRTHTHTHTHSNQCGIACALVQQIHSDSHNHDNPCIWCIRLCSLSTLQKV